MGASVQKHVLKNGLTVLLKPIHTAPIVSWRVLYRVGSRNERTGQTGVAHWVEHMMFKGPPHFPAGTLDRLVDREGGVWNAHTFIDFTAYYETMPADRIDLALRIEADRMTNALFAPEEVASERTVIISERQGRENSPLFWLGEEVNGAAFRVHPYHHEIIGDMADLESMTRDDLYGHYQRYYKPNNAIAVAVGDFDPAALLARVEELYGPIPAGELPAPFVRPEPEQRGERRVRVEREGNTAFLQVGYKVPNANHPDWFALAVLESVLGGPGGMGGGSVDNKTCRLYKALVMTEIAAAVNTGLTPTIDPFLFEIVLAVRDGRTLEEAEAALDAEIARIRTEDISQAELDKAIKQARALFAYSTEGVSGQSYWLAICENMGSYDWFETYVDRLSAVTVQDVRAAAEKYFDPRQRTVGWYIPTGDGDYAEGDDEGDEA